jgi:outer membrane biogenesis lipoprotein LolB
MKLVRFAFATVAFALLAACTADVTGPSLSKPGSASTSQGAIGVPH